MLLPVSKGEAVPNVGLDPVPLGVPFWEGGVADDAVEVDNDALASSINEARVKGADGGGGAINLKETK